MVSNLDKHDHKKSDLNEQLQLSISPSILELSPCYNREANSYLARVDVGGGVGDTDHDLCTTQFGLHSRVYLVIR